MMKTFAFLTVVRIWIEDKSLTMSFDRLNNIRTLPENTIYINSTTFYNSSSSDNQPTTFQADKVRESD
ncbi:MAG TPA: hypothetical protein VK612_05455 [Pyrinomonadaceae bacterium]|nr:hypothetical protein [Pyrinomonadaceae bacterium]